MPSCHARNHTALLTRSLVFKDVPSSSLAISDTSATMSRELLQDSVADSLDQEWLENLQGFDEEAPESKAASPKGKAKGKGKSAAGRGRGRGSHAAYASSGASSAKAKAKSKSRAKAFVNCKGCLKKTKTEDCATNFPGCRPCKRSLDNIWRAACRQGKKQMDFVQEARGDDDKCFSMVQSYLEACPEAAENTCGRKRGPWSVAKYTGHQNSWAHLGPQPRHS